MESQKVFCIGFHRTGTTSLAAAFRLLGYARLTGPNGVNNPNIGNEVHEMVHALAPKFDVFLDNPWPLLYQDLDARYPGSRFILTLRSTESWIRSVVKYFGDVHTPMREWIYGPGCGCPKGKESIYIARYERHNREVQDYFRDRPGDLLVLRFTEGDGWEKLCPFLGKPIPSVAFPHLNRAEDKKQARTMVGTLRRAWKKLTTA